MFKNVLRRPFFYLLAFFLLLFAIPKGAADKVRQSLLGVTLFSPTDPRFNEDGLEARVVIREPASWSSSVWIDVGEKTNERLGIQWIAKHSPVVVGDALIGVVEEVKKKKSRVRLITDQMLKPSVRVVRGKEQERLLFEKLTELSFLLRDRGDLYGAEEISRALLGFREQLDLEAEDLYLAKGVLHGSSAPLWRSLSHTLKGVGFNYDFSDEKGSARNLRTGALLDTYDPRPLIKCGDLLVTTGMDGIFPENLRVAIVTSISPLHEGGCSYSLEATPVFDQLHHLKEVTILQPVLTQKMR